MPTTRKESQAAAATKRPPATFGIREIWIMSLLVFVTLALYWPVRNHEFINYDDPDYITANPMVAQGATLDGIKWAFTSSHSYNWHPVTWISHMLDVQFFGINPGAHHLVSVVFHCFNSILLFWLLLRLTRTTWPGALVVAIFAWHPLHVESVAWACERKDVLSTMFWLLTTLFYLRFVEAGQQLKTGRPLNYSLALLCFALGLMSKPMLVTLPFTLLLLDYWPLRRISISNGSADVGVLDIIRQLWRLIPEKVPFFALSVASSVVTFLVQRKEGAVVQFEHLPLLERLGNAIVSYVRYIGKSIAPSDLVIYYQPTDWTGAQIGIAALLLLSFSCAAIYLARRQPFIFVGWFWFLGTLVPVIGIVQVGSQAIADRYMYVPMIGLSIAVVWPLAAIHSKKFRVIGSIVSVLALAGMMIISSRQISRWRNSETVFSHALESNPSNVVARVMLANSYLAEGRFADAEEQFRAALAITPHFPEVHFNLGNLYVQHRKVADAIASYQTALQQNPDYAEAHANLGVAFGMQQRFEEAIAHYERSLELQPAQPDLLRNLALDLMTLRRWEEARLRLEQALRIHPTDAMAHLLLGNVHLANGRSPEASRYYLRALELQPSLAEARERLEQLQAQAGP